MRPVTTSIFWVFNSPSTCPRGPMDPRGGRGTSADIVPTHIQFGVDLSTRCWDIAQKPPKCKNSPLTPIVTKTLFPLRPRGPLTPKMGEDTPGTRVRLRANFGVNRPAGCREIVDRTKKNRKNMQWKIVRYIAYIGIVSYRCFRFSYCRYINIVSMTSEISVISLKTNNYMIKTEYLILKHNTGTSIHPCWSETLVMTYGLRLRNNIDYFACGYEICD